MIEKNLLDYNIVVKDNVIDEALITTIVNETNNEREKLEAEISTINIINSLVINSLSHIVTKTSSHYASIDNTVTRSLKKAKPSEPSGSAKRRRTQQHHDVGCGIRQISSSVFDNPVNQL
jgi:hypothetical protein